MFLFLFQICIKFLENYSSRTDNKVYLKNSFASHNLTCLYGLKVKYIKSLLLIAREGKLSNAITPAHTPHKHTRTGWYNQAKNLPALVIDFTICSYKLRLGHNQILEIE